MNLKDMDWNLSLIAASQALSSEAREAARRASELLCAFRTINDLPWLVNAADLHTLALDVGNELQIRRETK